MDSGPRRIGLLYEHPTWSLELIRRLEARDVELERLDVGAEVSFDEACHAGPRGRSTALAAGPAAAERWINRVNALPSAGRPPSVVAATGHALLDLELRGQRVINGHRAWSIGASKRAQGALFARLGLATPASIPVAGPAEAPAAADELGYPVLVKPNVGGSGSGIERFETPDDLRDAVVDGRLALGIDGTGLVQRIVEPSDGLVHRIEMLGRELFYATDQPVEPGVFNYCAADGCAVDGGIALTSPDQPVIDAAAAVMEAAGAQVGGVEYLLDRSTGQPCFFDLNPYSNFLAGRDAELGFDPIERYLDHVLA